MKKHFIAAMAVVCLTLLSHGAQKVTAAELLTNGGFELGNFTGWNVTNASNSFINWNVSTAGAGGGFIPVPVVTSPVEGTRDAWQGIASQAGSSYILYQEVTLPAGTAQLRWRDRLQDNLQEFCGSSGEPVCGTVTYRVDIVNTSNVVLQNLHTFVAPANANTDTGWQLHFVNMNAFAGQTIRIRFMTTPTVTWDGPGQLEIDAVSLQSPALTTAAEVSVGGRVTTQAGAGIGGATVTITNSNGNSQTTTTGTLGYYNFAAVEVGASYIIEVQKRRYTFLNNPMILTVNDTVINADFQSSQ